jgi:hypothetical protein
MVLAQISAVAEELPAILKDLAPIARQFRRIRTTAEIMPVLAPIASEFSPVAA